MLLLLMYRSVRCRKLFTFNGDNVISTFNWVPGSWPSEISLQILDGSSVGSYGPYATTGLVKVFDGVSNSICVPSACLDPYGLTAGNITDSSVDISWTGGPNATSYNVEYTLLDSILVGINGYLVSATVTIVTRFMIFMCNRLRN